MHLSLLLTAVIWGGTTPGIKHLLGSLKPVDVMALRLGGAAIVFLVVLIGMGKGILPHSWGDALKLLALGGLGITVMNYALINGQRLVPSATASLIVTSNPVYTALISRIVTGEPLTRRKIGGIALAFTGFLVVLLYGSGKGAALDAAHVKGMLIVGIAPFSWAFYTVLSKPFLTRYSPTHVAAYTTIAGAIGAIPLFVLDRGAVGRIGALDATGWSVALFLAAVGVVLAYILWYRGLQVLSPSQTAVYIYLVPVFGLFFAWWFLGEEITPFLLLGGAIILAGVGLTNSGGGRRRAVSVPAMPELAGKAP